MGVLTDVFSDARGFYLLSRFCLNAESQNPLAPNRKTIDGIIKQFKISVCPSDFSCVPSLPRSRDTFPHALLRHVTFTCRHNSSQTLVAAFT